MEQPENIAAMERFYKLKQKYESQNQKAKSKIRNNPNLSLAEKKERFRMLKPKCVNCKKPVGTVFSSDNRTLTALCGAANEIKNVQPCNLDIKIKKGTFITLDKKVKKLKKTKENTEKDIILSKLNLLFNFKTEDETVEQFESLYEFYKKDCDNYINALNDYLTITEKLNKKEEINITTLQLYEFKQEIKKLLLEGEKDPLKTKQMVKESIEIYINKVLKILEVNEKLNYSYRDVDFNNNDKTYHLIQKPYTISELEVPIERGSILLSNN